MISCRRWQCERPRPAFCARSREATGCESTQALLHWGTRRAITRCALVRQAQTRFDDMPTVRWESLWIRARRPAVLLAGFLLLVEVLGLIGCEESFVRHVIRRPQDAWPPVGRLQRH